MGNKEFYRLARAYDIAFSTRDFEEESDFLLWCLQTFGSAKGKKFLELACGPANHARVFAKRGWKTFALDLSEDMIAYAKQKDAVEGVAITYLAADMVEYKLPERVSLVVNPMESISHIITNEGMLLHLKNVSESLTKGGIYVIEGTHPRYFMPDEEPNRWTEYDGETEVEVLFGLPEDEYDPIGQYWMVTTEISMTEPGKKKLSAKSKHTHRWYLKQEMDTLIRLSKAFSEWHFFGNAAIPPHPLDNSDQADAMIIVLKK